jgi:hypothetical protein
VLGIAGVDLFIPILTYVFGEAQLAGRAAVVSTYRLDNALYGLPANHRLLLDRLAKEAIHELGHTAGSSLQPSRVRDAQLDLRRGHRSQVGAILRLVWPARSRARRHAAALNYRFSPPAITTGTSGCFRVTVGPCSWPATSCSSPRPPPDWPRQIQEKGPSLSRLNSTPRLAVRARTRFSAACVRARTR